MKTDLKRNSLFFILLLSIAVSLYSSDLEFEYNWSLAHLAVNTSFRNDKSLFDALDKGYHSEIEFQISLNRHSKNSLLPWFMQDITDIKVKKEAWWDPFEQVYKLKIGEKETIDYRIKQKKQLSEDFFSYSHEFFIPDQERDTEPRYTIKASVKWRKVVLVTPVNILYIIPYYLVEKSGWETFNIP
ncbi:hypothetical protein [Spirochaeta cellobiosiphila]|uniref:hypothetical protein n=1 Tax=Spirochaeta cellobiosiphila TaxID=504483 RepID=UPI00041B6A33|nr:hypothetical protein [Spirochaeta cellobiosiphila]